MTESIPLLSGLMLGVAVLSWWLTGRVRAYAMNNSLMDVPNARSSHVLPTPRGGGLAIVLSFFAAVVALRLGGLLDNVTTFSLLTCGGTVALAGFVDDHGHIPASWRLLVHFVVAAGVLWLLLPAAAFGRVLPGVPMYLAYAVALVFLVWLLNLYNFMDGIDGIAGVETVTTCLVAGAMLALAGAGALAWLAWALGLSAAGFLVWNTPPAKIFMGDVGSGFLGIMLGALAVMSAAVDARFFWGWIVLLAVFIADASVTLVRRGLRGERVHEAHRSHAYQRAARRFGSHARVTLATGLINLFWLTPVAGLMVVGAIPPAVGVPLAYAPVVVLAWCLGAGLPDEPPAA